MNMSDINKIFKGAIDGYEAPFDPSAWDKLSTQLNNPMEDAFRNSLEGHEAPYNPKAWSAIKGKIGGTPNIFRWIAGSAAAVLLVTTAIILFPSNEEDGKTNKLVTTTNTTTPKNAIETIHATNTPENNSTEIKVENETATLETESNTTDDSNQEVIASDQNVGEADPQTTIDNTNDGHDFVSAHSAIINEESTPQTDSPIVTVPNPEEGSAIGIIYSAEFSVSEMEICLGETVLLDPKMLLNTIEYEWNFGDGNLSNSIKTSHEYNSAGVYNVLLTMRDKKTKQILTNESKSITVNKSPEIKFGFDQANEFIPAYIFRNESEISTDLTWRIDNRLFADKNTFDYTFREKGTYSVELTGVNEFGCNNSNRQEILIDKDFNLGAPTAFAPESTTEYTFMPSALKIMNKEFKMIIYNSAGNPIYQTSNANEPWTGIDINTNAAAPAGTMYTWIVYLTNTNGTTDRYFGQVLKL